MNNYEPTEIATLYQVNVPYETDDVHVIFDNLHHLKSYGDHDIPLQFNLNQVCLVKTDLYRSLNFVPSNTVARVAKEYLEETFDRFNVFRLFLEDTRPTAENLYQFVIDAKPQLVFCNPRTFQDVLLAFDPANDAVINKLTTQSIQWDWKIHNISTCEIVHCVTDPGNLDAVAEILEPLALDRKGCVPATVWVVPTPRDAHILLAVQPDDAQDLHDAFGKHGDSIRCDFRFQTWPTAWFKPEWVDNRLAKGFWGSFVRLLDDLGSIDELFHSFFTYPGDGQNARILYS